MLDLSLRNPLLSYKFRASSKRQLHFVDTTLETVYRSLVIDEEELEFCALPDPPDIPPDEKTEEFLSALSFAKASDVEYLTRIEALGSQGRDDEFALAGAERELRDRLRQKHGLPTRPTRKTLNPTVHARDYGIDPSLELPAGAASASKSRLQTLKWPDTLDAILDKIADEARLAEQEMGFSTLYLAFGFLEWIESDESAKRHFAPILLLPVKLKKDKTKRGKIVYRLMAADDMADINVSLQKRVAGDVNRALPSFPVTTDIPDLIEAYLRAVTAVIDGLNGWRIHRWLVLGHFNFSRFAIFDDLDPVKWPQHPALDKLVGPVLGASESTEPDEGSLFSEPDDHPIDDLEVERIAPFLIQNADGSQHSALIDVSRGENLVIQGPPGTGKSQTMANIIANAMAAGKTVLFLAEKQAALEVVKRRLDRSGLGEFCLELHSDKTSSRLVVESLKARHALGYSTRPTTPITIPDDFPWQQSRRYLKEYLTALHREESDGRTLFDLIWQSLRARSKLGMAVDVCAPAGVPAALVEDIAAFESVRSAISLYAQMLAPYMRNFGPPRRSSLAAIDFGSRPGRGIAAGLLNELEGLRKDAARREQLTAAAESLGFAGHRGLNDIIQLDRALTDRAPPDGPTLHAIKAIELDDLESLVHLVTAAETAVAPESGLFCSRQ